MLVVSDSSPLHLLAELGQTEILAGLFGQVIIPPEVADELSSPNAPSSVRQLIATPPPWLSQSSPRARLNLDKLDPGESAAISLALELAVPLLIDERAGRAAAQAHGVVVVGAIGVLERAADRGLIPDLAAAHAVIRTLTFRVADCILDESLARHQERRSIRG